MRKLVLSVLFGLAVALSLVAVAFAKEYVITVTVDGKPITLSVVVNGDALTVNTRSPGAEVVSLTEVKPTPQTATTTATATRNANLRGGPGTTYPVVGGVRTGQALTITGRNGAGDWLQLTDGKWIATFLVKGAPAGLPVVGAPVAQPLQSAIQPTPITPPVAPPAVTANCVNGCTAYPDWCAPPIKGNISYNTGEKIYHVPGQEYYNDTVIDPGDGERWFCTEQEAQAAGWRRSKR